MTVGQDGVDILWFVEHIARELDTACAVKHWVETRSDLRLDVVSIVHRLEETLASSARPRLLAVPYCYSAEGDRALLSVLTRWPDVPVVNLAFEQIYHRANLKVKRIQDEFARRWVLHHAWGPPYREFLGSCGVPAENVVLNGNPSYTLYQPPYRDLFPSREELAERHGLDVSSRWVFVPDQYGTAFLSDDMLSSNLVHKGYTLEEAHTYRDWALASFHEVADWCRAAAELPGVEVILRPRPATPADLYAQVFAESGEKPAHLHLNKESTVRDWSLASDLVASSFSTSLIEAAVGERPVAMLGPRPFPDFLYMDWYEHIPKVESRQAFLELVTREELEPSWRGLVDWARGTYLAEGDAIRGLADLLVEACASEGAKGFSADDQREWLETRERERADEEVEEPPQAAGPRARIGAVVQGILSRVKSAPAADAPWSAHSRDEFSAQDVARRVEDWARILGSERPT